MTVDEALNLAVAHHQGGRLAEAEEIYREILRHDPQHPHALHLLGLVAHQGGDHAGAVELMSRAIAIESSVAFFHSNLGEALAAVGQLDAAAGALRRAIELGNLPQAHYNLGNVLREMGRLDAAAESFEKSIRLRPEHALSHNNLGIVRQEQGRTREAIELFREAMRLDPHDAEAHSNMLFALYLDPEMEPGRILEEHRGFERAHAVEPLPSQLGTAVPHGHWRMRVGYVSPDFRDHPVARFMEPVLRHHDREGFEIYCYSDLRRADATTERLRGLADAWRDSSKLTHEELARCVREDGIDVLVDLALHSADNRMLTFLRKPAPVQVSYLGYPGTTGLSAMDFRLSDSLLDPAGTEGNYSERTVRLPRCYWCYSAPGEAGEVMELPARGAGTITFGCLNNASKLSEPALVAWGRILREVSSSRLLVHCPVGSACQRVRELVGSDRIEFVPLQGRADYFATYNRIDVALDPFPWSGGTTTFDALWMGVPVVSLRGRTSVGRAGASILGNLGHAEWVADSTDQYAEIAIGLASDLDGLGRLRAGLRDELRRSRLMDGAAFTRDLENAYREIWATARGGG